ncbi:hypothetical protein PGB34_09915 [Xenophilus arseniciresistens]|uniref:Uncharacterized protein n=1 Tax=Xenophilus arseniciresistens TaxID=1283306 RepID=A0AAE3N8U0_9BURK|nr:hypothetical protein [Xenophilus arseniciresistens]MDA7416679.1 hypothetical protein [Xenophilus arseniciresistens]
MKKGLAQYLIAAVLVLLAAIAVMQGDPALAGLGWVRAATEVAAPAGPPEATPVPH